MVLSYRFLDNKKDGHAVLFTSSLRLRAYFLVVFFAAGFAAVFFAVPHGPFDLQAMSLLLITDLKDLRDL
jgi:hypothetical protein